MADRHPRRDVMRRVRQVHFVGIGGVGMSGIAEVLLNLGFKVSGSDLAASPATRRLSKLGATISEGHDAKHIASADVVVASGAVPQDNPEIVAARAERLPVVPRAEMLAELMRFRQGIAVAGTHGKTTTTSLIASLLGEAGLDPTFVIGGRLNSAGGGARLGAGDYLVAEADESDGSFLLLAPMIAVVTNVDADHLGAYGGRFDTLRQAFADFLQRLPFYGVAILCADDPVVATLAVSRQVVTFGTIDGADVRALDVEPSGGQMHFKLILPGSAPFPVTLNLPGHHNVLNALAACAVAYELGIEPSVIRRGLENFGGIGRRFEVAEIPTPKGPVLLVDDYGHHPREIAATLDAARAGWPDRRVVLVFQPHRYSRTRDLFDDFVQSLSQADALVLVDVYAAGEPPIPGADGRALARAIRARGQIDPILVNSVAELPAILPGVIEQGDLLLLQGAGDIGAVAARFARNGLQAESGS